MRHYGLFQACRNAVRQAVAAAAVAVRPGHGSTVKTGLGSCPSPETYIAPTLRSCRGFRDTVGSTPLIMLRSASKETGCTIWGKCEFLNPGGSVKDRPAVKILKKAEEDGKLLLNHRLGLLAPGAWVVEASAGNTAIALTLAAKERKYRVICVMPESQTEEKKRLLRVLGAIVLPVPFQKIAHPNHYIRIAKRLADKLGGFWCGQFDNTVSRAWVSIRDTAKSRANRQAHFETTGPEIWSQTGGKIDGFICAAGTGGTITGVASSLRMRRQEQLGNPSLDLGLMHYLKGSTSHALACTDTPIQDPAGAERTDPATQSELRDRFSKLLTSGGPCIGLADVRGAGLFRLYTTGILSAEGSSIVENIGQNRVTGNLEGFSPDFACEIPDEEALTWTYRLLQEEGLMVGMTSGVNVGGAVRLARAMGPGHQIVTVLCDYGHLYASKQWNPPFLRSLSLPAPAWMDRDVHPEVLAALEASFVHTNESNKAD